MPFTVHDAKLLFRRDGLSIKKININVLSPFWLAFKIGMHVYFNSLSATYLFPIHPIKLQSSNKFTSTFFHPLNSTRTIPWVNPILKNISALSREILRIRVSTKMWKPYFTTFHYFYYLSSMKFYYLLTAFLYLRNLNEDPAVSTSPLIAVSTSTIKEWGIRIKTKYVTPTLCIKQYYP